MQSEDKQDKRPRNVEKVNKGKVVHFDVRDQREVLHVLSNIAEGIFDTRDLLIHYLVKKAESLERVSPL